MFSDKNLFEKSTKILKSIYGKNANFRDGQYEAIEATMNNNRTLVVQKTGWGKSLVYFICTKINREAKNGVTFVISPLLVLMDNQLEAAKSLGLKCDLLNSTVKDRKSEIIASLKRNELDMIFITPETLFSEEMLDAIPSIKIGLFVIDEIHCISDWGHDFRLEYGKLYKILNMIPKNVPVLGTTATANNRVVQDLKKQLGDKVYVSRGPLTRDSLAIQVLHLSTKAERYAWILQYINKLPGSGIVYCLTHHDCEHLSKFLNENGVAARPYYSRKDDELNQEAICLFMKNEIKAIVATTKLGMGYDKSDVGFVIHFQQPSNIVSYYQQIGRAGRNLDYANIILMSGQEDNAIIDYFINNAFPSEEDVQKIINVFKTGNGFSINDVLFRVNLRKNGVTKVLAFLEHEEFLYKENSKYYLSPKKYTYNREHYNKITKIRRQEQQQMLELINTNQCLSQFIVNKLDDTTALPCNKCINCLQHDIIPSQIDSDILNKAYDYINGSVISIDPRKRWPNKNYHDTTVIKYINQVGICLSKYGDVGYGEMVKKDKYSGNNRFNDQLLERSYLILKSFIKENNITHITNVPSLRSNIVKDFAQRLAQKLNITYIDTIKKIDASPQKEMQNSNYQFQNAYESFCYSYTGRLPKNIILFDDIVDSKWTITVCGYMLMENGCEKVFPFVLADSSYQED